jgi:hypothetical protein
MAKVNLDNVMKGIDLGINLVIKGFEFGKLRRGERIEKIEKFIKQLAEQNEQQQVMIDELLSKIK